MTFQRSIICLVLLAPPCLAEDWPTWQHDNRRTGATEEQLDTQQLKLDWTWESSAPPQPAWAGPAKYDAYAFHHNLPSMRNYDAVFHPIAVGGHLWFGSSVDDSVYCLRADDGHEQWVVTTHGPVRVAPTWSEGRVYFGSDDGHARCVDAKTGRLIWKYSPPKADGLVLSNGKFISFQPCRTGIVVEAETAWFACAMLPWKDSFLCSVDAATGKPDSPEHFVKSLPGRTMEGAPALSSSAIIFPQGRVAPRVFDRHTGDDLGAMAKSGGGSVVVVTLDESILHGPASDSRKGGFRQSSNRSRERVAALGRGNALVVDGTDCWMLTDDTIVASNLTSQKVHWETPCDCPYSLIKAGDTLFVGGDQMVAAYSAKDGRRLWQHAAKGRIFSLLAANGRLFTSSDTGVIHCYSPSGNKVLAQSFKTAGKPTEQKADIKVVPPTNDDRLLGHWAFQPSSTTGNSVKALRGNDLTLAGPPRFSRLGNHHALELDGTKETAMVSPSFANVPHPTGAFTATAWLRLDQWQNWGGIIGIVQDNGSYEKGWLLGYRKDRFCVAVSSENGPGKLTYLTTDQSAQLSRWYHVTGTYDGETMRLFVNGQPCAESKEQSGNIAYPPRGWFEIGAYHDEDEYFRMAGAIHEVQLYDRALSHQEIVDQYQATKSRVPAAAETIELASGPWLTFNDPRSATVRWSTTMPEPTHLEFGSRDLSQQVFDAAPKTQHQAVLTGFDRNRLYHFRIAQGQGDEIQFTDEFECDNFFNYSPPSAERISQPLDVASQPFAQRLLDQTDVDRGMCLVIGELGLNVLTELCRASQMRFVIALPDAGDVETTRSLLRARGIYGNQITVHHADDLDKLRFTGNWANLVVVANDSLTASVIREAQFQTRPNGGVTLVIGANAADLPAGFNAVDGNQNETSLHRQTKPALPGAGDWSHLYGKPDNSAFGGEQLGGASSADDLEVQWIGRPGPRYQADRSGRKPSPLAINGRLFLQGLHRIIAIDAFNGTILWSIEIPGLERFNMPRDCSNWCGNQDYLFVAVKDECWKISTSTGKVVQRIPAAEDSKRSMDWGYIATDDNRLYGSAVRAGTSWTSFWGGGDAGWYDARSGAVTHPICSDQLVCRDTESMNPIWRYKRGVVLNPTITVSDDTMYFLQSRSNSVLVSTERRIGDPDLWQHLYLVAIDAYTGEAKWEKRLPPMEPQVVCYLAHADQQLTLVSSSNKSYRVTSFHDHNGDQRWTNTTSWPGGKGDHGKAMMRPAIVGGRIFLRPHVLSLTDGTVLPEKMPDGHGCGTYACTATAIFYRAKTVTMWDPAQNRKSTWSRLRPDCWLSTIPAGGMLLSPEGGGGCSCGSWLETSLGFLPRAFNQR